MQERGVDDLYGYQYGPSPDTKIYQDHKAKSILVFCCQAEVLRLPTPLKGMLMAIVRDGNVEWGFPIGDILCGYMIRASQVRRCSL